MATLLTPVVATQIYVRIPAKYVFAFQNVTGYRLQFFDLGDGYVAVKIADVADSRLIVDFPAALLLLLVVELYKRHLKEVLEMFESAVIRAHKYLEMIMHTPEVTEVAQQVAQAVAQTAAEQGSKIVELEKVAEKPQFRKAAEKLSEIAKKLKIILPLFEKSRK